MQRGLAPLLLILLGVAVLPGMDAIAKLLTGLATVSTISCIRYVTQVVISAPVAWRQGRGELWPPRHAKLQVLRALCFAAGGLLFFAGVQHLPLADNLAITFAYPFMVAALAPLALRETLTVRQLLAMALGFAGTVVIVRPGSGVFGAAALFPLGFSACYAGYVVLTRMLATRDTPASVLQLWVAVFSTLWVGVVFAIAALLELPSLAFHVESPLALGGMVAMGVVGTFAHWLITIGARHVAAGIQAVLGYSEIVSTTLLGWLIWHELPDTATWIGMMLVIASGIWLLRLREG